MSPHYETLILSLKGLIHFYKHEYELAESDFSFSLQINPHDYLTLIRRANLYCSVLYSLPRSTNMRMPLKTPKEPTFATQKANTWNSLSRNWKQESRTFLMKLRERDFRKIFNLFLDKLKKNHKLWRRSL